MEGGWGEGVHCPGLIYPLDNLSPDNWEAAGLLPPCRQERWFHGCLLSPQCWAEDTEVKQWQTLPLGSERSLLFFPCQCEDSKVDALGEALQTTVSRWRCKFSAPLPLELYTSSNFIGLFVKEDSAEVLKKFAADFAAEAASKTGEPPAARPASPGNREVRKEGDRK